MENGNCCTGSVDTEMLLHNARDFCNQYWKALSIKTHYAKQQGEVEKAEKLLALLNASKKEFYESINNLDLQRKIIDTYPDKINIVLSDGMPWLFKCEICGVILNEPTAKHDSFCPSTATIEIDRINRTYRILGTNAEIKVIPVPEEDGEVEVR